jgi:hypothetical protein
MTANHTTSKDIDAYIAGVPEEIRAILERIKTTIHNAAPEAQETISFQMPTFRLEGNEEEIAPWISPHDPSDRHTIYTTVLEYP